MIKWTDEMVDALRVAYPNGNTRETASEQNAATGNERKLAAASPSAASKALQQKMMPRPRAKYLAKPRSICHGR